MKQIGVVFDLDDTLISTSGVYYTCLLDVMKLVQRDCHPHFIYPGDILGIFHNVEDRIHRGESKKSPYWVSDEVYTAATSFPREMAETYAECLLSLGIAPDTEGVEKAYKIGCRVMHEKYRLMPGVRRLLYFIERRNDLRPFIITHGDEKLQSPKVQNHECFLGMERIIICPFSSDKGEVIKDLAKEYDDIQEWIVVGDSVKRDINPALANGFLACHVAKVINHKDDGDLIAVGSALDRYKHFEDINEFHKFLSERIRGEKVQTKV